MAKSTIIGPVRFSYCHLLEPDTRDGSDKYSVSILIDKSNTALVKTVKDAIYQAYQDGLTKFGPKAPAINSIKLPVRDGDTERDDNVYAGNYFINCYTNTRPGVVKFGPNGTKVPVNGPEDIYSGCYGYVAVRFFAYNNNGNKGISCYLNNVLVTERGESLGGAESAEESFADIQPTQPVGTVNNIDDDQLF